MKRHSLITVLQAEPDASRLLLKVAAIGAIGLTLWSGLGDVVFGDIPFVVITLAAAAAYAAALVYFTGSLVRDADRWQVESALQARRLLSTGRHASQQEPADPSPTTFDHWYFVLRLEDEIKRARRYGKPVSVVIMRIASPSGEGSPAVVEQINFDVAQIAANHANTMTMPSAIGPQEYAFLLPETDRQAARARVAPLLNPLGDYYCDCGIAVYPDDSTEAESLVHIARRQIELDRLQA